MNKLMPRQLVPDLRVKALSGKVLDVQDSAPGAFTMIVFYRGRHCPVCKNYLSELNRLIGDFADRDVDVMTISGDTEERARQARDDWDLDQLDLGFGLELSAARRWGLYISSSRGKTSIGVEEPPQFSEPGIFLVRPDKSLYWGNVQSMPFARPHFREILGALDFVASNDYPARGEA